MPLTKSQILNIVTNFPFQSWMNTNESDMSENMVVRREWITSPTLVVEGRETGFVYTLLRIQHISYDVCNQESKVNGMCEECLSHAYSAVTSAFHLPSYPLIDMDMDMDLETFRLRPVKRRWVNQVE